MDADEVIAAQLEYLRAGGVSKPKRVTRLERRLVANVEKLEQLERELARAFNRWCKCRNSIKRDSTTLDKIAKESTP